ncbi:MAG TPA: DUF3810 family protein, partial [Clostridia bacterium]|nr:DUF3810 family protein [Clostridia bacterium]
MRMGNETPSIVIPSEWKTLIARLPWVLLIPVGMLIKAFASRHPEMVERIYSGGLYPFLHRVFSSVFGILPFSFAEILFVLLALTVPALLLYTLIKALLKRLPWSKFAGLVLTIIIAAGAIYNAFYLLWGLNYSRPKLSI